MLLLLDNWLDILPLKPHEKSLHPLQVNKLHHLFLHANGCYFGLGLYEKKKNTENKRFIEDDKTTVMNSRDCGLLYNKPDNSLPTPPVAKPLPC